MKSMSFSQWMLALFIATIIHLLIFSQFTRKIRVPAESANQGITFNLMSAYSAKPAAGQSARSLQKNLQPVAKLLTPEVRAVNPPDIQKKTVKTESKKKPAPANKNVVAKKIKVKRSLVKKEKPLNLKPEKQVVTNWVASVERHQADVLQQQKQPSEKVLEHESVAALDSYVAKSSSGVQISAGSPQGGSSSAESSNTLGAIDARSRQQEYASTLLAWITKHKRYPKRARRKNQQGIVELTFTVNALGQLLSQDIVKSSGYKLLDEETKKMLKRALPFPGIPVQMNAEKLTFTVPVSFSLK